MAKVICTLDHASEEISGIKFSAAPDGGMVSEEISDEQAALLASINGYALVVAPAPAPAAKAAKKAAPAPAPVPVPAPEPDPAPAADDTY